MVDRSSSAAKDTLKDTGFSFLSSLNRGGSEVLFFDFDPDIASSVISMTVFMFSLSRRRKGK